MNEGSIDLEVDEVSDLRHILDGLHSLVLQVKGPWQLDVAVLIWRRDVHLACSESIRSDCYDLKPTDLIQISL